MSSEAVCHHEGCRLAGTERDSSERFACEEHAAKSYGWLFAVRGYADLAGRMEALLREQGWDIEIREPRGEERAFRTYRRIGTTAFFEPAGIETERTVKFPTVLESALETAERAATNR